DLQNLGGGRLGGDRRAGAAVLEEKSGLVGGQRVADRHRHRTDLHRAPEGLGELRTVRQGEEHALLDLDVAGPQRVAEATGAEGDLAVGDVAAGETEGDSHAAAFGEVAIEKVSRGVETLRNVDGHRHAADSSSTAWIPALLTAPRRREAPYGSGRI